MGEGTGITIMMMKCGCRAVGSVVMQSGERIPFCVIHSCYETVPDPDLTGRMAKCPYCKNTQPSATTLAFFQHRPDQALDSYYCGCCGWD